MEVRRGLNLQGVATGDAIVDNAMFYDLTSSVRKTFVKNRAWSGAGSLDTITIPKVGLCGDLYVTVTADVLFGAAPNGLPTWNWPLNLVAGFNLSANGVTNLIDVPGAFLKAHEIIGDMGTIDRSISRLAGGSAVTNGHLATSAQDSWVFGPAAAYTTAGTTPVQMTYKVPVLLEETHGTGLIYAQTSATNIALNLRWPGLTDLFKSDGTQPTMSNVTYTVSGDVFSIPTVRAGRDGTETVEVLPELSTLHMYRYAQFPLVAAGSALEFEIPQIGPGKQLLRVIGRGMNGVTLGAGPTASPMNPATSFTEVAAYFGTNDLIREYTGVEISSHNEKSYGCGIGLVHGFWALDLMDKNNAIRDTRDEANSAGLRVRLSTASAVTITQPARVELAIEEAVTAQG